MQVHSDSALNYIPPSVVRVDPAPGFSSLFTEILRQPGVTIEVEIKNLHKNPVAEKCTAELGDKLLCICLEGSSISPVLLGIVTANLNSCIRNRG